MRTIGKIAAALTLLLLGAAVPGAPGTAAQGESPVFAASSDKPEWVDFTLLEAGGGPVSMSRFIGKKPVLLIFWATWCPHCDESVPAINTMHSEPPTRDTLEIFALDYMESREKVRAFIERKKVAFRVLLDSDGSVARKYGVIGIPTYILIDRRGNVVFRGYEIPEAARYLR
jgi:peroxiredoxin